MHSNEYYKAAYVFVVDWDGVAGGAEKGASKGMGGGEGGKGRRRMEGGCSGDRTLLLNQS